MNREIINRPHRHSITSATTVIVFLFIIFPSSPLLCSSPSHFTFVSGASPNGCFGLDGITPCGGAGICYNLTLAVAGYGAEQQFHCLCDPGRYELDGSPSWEQANPTCSYSLSSSSSSLYQASLFVMGTLLVGTLIAVIFSCIRVTCRRVGKETRFERLLVAGTDVLKPSPVQLRFARLSYAFILVAILIWCLEFLVDPFGGNGTLNKGGYSVELDSIGRTVGSGYKTRWILEDLGEWLLLIPYLIFFTIYRKVCIPAPTLLSGDRFQKSWFSSSNVEPVDQKVPTEDNLYTQTVMELEAEEKKLADAEHSSTNGGDDPTTRGRRLEMESQRHLRHLHDQLHSPYELNDEEMRREARRIAADKKFNREGYERRQMDISSGLYNPPPPPPSPPTIPPPLKSSAAKYAVTSEDDAVASSSSDSDSDSHPSHPVVSPTHIHKHFVEARRNLLADLDDATLNDIAQDSHKPRPGTEAAHDMHRAAHVKEIEEEAVKPLPTDELQPDVADLASFPVPDSLKLIHFTQVLVAVLMIVLLFVADYASNNRLLFSGILFVVYIIFHCWYLYFLLTYWDPLYLISLKEDLLLEAGMPLPKHRLISKSAGSDTGAPTSTIHFGIRTAYELSKVHTLYQWLTIKLIIVTLIQNIIMLYLAYADLDTMNSTPMIAWSIFNKLLQCARIGNILFIYYPFQPMIQYLTLHSFWLDQRLELTPSHPMSEMHSLVPQLELHDTDVEAPPPNATPHAGVMSGRIGTATGRRTNRAFMQTQTIAQPKVDMFPSTRIERGCMACIPLYISTSFRPIPTRSELLAKRQMDALPKLLADLKRIRAIDKGRDGGGPGGLSGGLNSWKRLWRAGARYEKNFVTEPNTALLLDAMKSEEFEKKIAHQQFVLWRRQHWKARGLDEAGQPITPFARRKQAIAEKMIEDAKSKSKSHLPSATVNPSGAGNDTSTGSMASTELGTSDDPFKNLQEYYGDPDGALVRAAVRAQAKRNRIEFKLTQKQQIIEDIRRLREMSTSIAKTRIQTGEVDSIERLPVVIGQPISSPLSSSPVAPTSVDPSSNNPSGGPSSLHQVGSPSTAATPTGSSDSTSVIGSTASTVNRVAPLPISSSMTSPLKLSSPAPKRKVQVGLRLKPIPTQPTNLPSMVETKDDASADTAQQILYRPFVPALLSNGGIGSSVTSPVGTIEFLSDLAVTSNELEAVLNEPDDFISVSRHQPNGLASPSQTYRGNHMELETPRL